MSKDNPSTYFQTLRQIDLEREASIRGLLGPAIVASHACIEARITQGANRILDLIKQERVSEALLLMEQPGWGEKDTPPVVNSLKEDRHAEA
jgi:hypothetical protein